jgi:hypothetical protein
VHCTSNLLHGGFKEHVWNHSNFFLLQSLRTDKHVTNRSKAEHNALQITNLKGEQALRTTNKYRLRELPLLTKLLVAGWCLTLRNPVNVEQNILCMSNLYLLGPLCSLLFCSLLMVDISIPT